MNVNSDNTSDSEYLVTNKKSNLFNIVIGIATLLIALLGATFAYFSATATSDVNDVNLKSAYLSISYDGGTKIEANELIPSAMYIAMDRYKRTTDSSIEGSGPRCIDARGNQVCYVYQFSITSELDDASGETSIVGSVKVEENGFDNLSYVLYEVDFAKNDDGSDIMDIIKWQDGTEEKQQVLERVSNYSLLNFNFEYTANDGVIEPEENNPFFGTKFSKFLKPKDTYDEEGAPTGTTYPVACLFGYSEDYESKSLDDTSRCGDIKITNGEEHIYQLVIWLQETGEDQPEQKKSFAGTVSIEVAGGKDSTGYTDGRVTGTLD